MPRRVPPRAAAFAPVLAARAVVVLRGPAAVAARGRRLGASVHGGDYAAAAPAATAIPGCSGNNNSGSSSARVVGRRIALQMSASSTAASASSGASAAAAATGSVPMAAAAATGPRTAPAGSSSSSSPSPAPPLTFQDALARLQEYWRDRGCVLWHPYNTEVGAGTMNPATFLRVLGPEPWAVAYDEPSVRPDDSRYGENPNRLQCHTQFQVILKPAPDCAQELVVGSYRALGIDVTARDIRFVEDNWESPALGAWGLGWEVWLDGMEITQFTYFQQAGSVGLDTVSVEITYGLERIIMALQGKTHFKDIVYAPGITYGEILMQNEIEMSRYHLDEADTTRNRTWFDEYEAEAIQLLEKRLPVPAYNYLLKASHTFNVLDSRGAVGVTERARYFQRMRTLARDVAQLWIERRQELDFPLLALARDTHSARQTPLGRGSSLPPLMPAPSLDAQVAAMTALGDTCNFLFELGVEELPAADVSRTAEQFESLLIALLQNVRLDHGPVQVDATPRRIVATVVDLQTKQKDVSKRVRGPPLRAAVGADGELTRAGTGFLKSQGISDKSKAEFDHDAGYMYALIEEAGRDAASVFADLLPHAVLSKIVFSKAMRWNASGVTFSRPIRWMLCMLDGVYVPFEYAGIPSGTTTRTLRRGDGFAHNLSVASSLEYRSLVALNQIMIAKSARASHIRDEATMLASSIGGVIPAEHLNGALLNEVADLVENPLPLLGRFDKDFLNLPQDVLVTVMKKHQRYFPIIDQNGDLVNAFVTVINGDSSLVDMKAIRAGNEAVLRARYADAAFFYQKDTENRNLADFLPALSGLTFQDKLGSMRDKVERVKVLTPKLANLMGLGDGETKAAVETADLYKADLGTLMVIEMTALAGIMGRHYALKSGEVSVDVAEAILEAALPRFSGDQLPKSNIGAVVAIADRLDSLVSLFSVGLVPKSTADPFALRRAALGIVQTLIAIGIPLRLNDAIATLTSDQSLAKSVLDFISKRLEVYLSDQGFRPDIVKAVLAAGENAADPCLAFACVSAMQAVLDSTSDSDLVSNAYEVHGRSLRLVRSVAGGSGSPVSSSISSAQSVDESLFEAEVENALYKSILRAEDAIRMDGSLTGRLRVVANTKQEVDAFCDGVFVAAEDLAVRNNRVAMLERIVQLSNPVIDLTLLQL